MKNLYMERIQMSNNRIAVHVLYDFCLPLQKGKPLSEERKASNLEIQKVLEENNCDYDNIMDAGYFIPDEWEWVDVENIRFKNSKGEWETVKKSWVIFEKENPDFLKGLDSQGV